MIELDATLLRRTIAQSSDAIARPTFTTDLEFGQSTNPPPSTVVTGTIKLTTNASGFNVGSEFSVAIQVDSNSLSIKGYTIKVNYPSSKLEIVDNNTTTTGIQIEHVLSGYTVETNLGNNSTGTVIIKATTASPAAVKATVANIKFKVIAAGAADIQVSTSESSLVQADSKNVLGGTTGLQLTAGESIGTATELNDTPLIPASAIADIKNLPKSDLPFSGIIYILTGLGFIFLGLLGKRFSKQRSI